MAEYRVSASQVGNTALPLHHLLEHLGGAPAPPHHLYGVPQLALPLHHLLEHLGGTPAPPRHKQLTG